MGESVKSGESRGASGDGHWISQMEFARLQSSLQEAQETLDAIRNGEVDAVVVRGANGNQIYSLSGAEHPYRIYVEQMQEGAVTVAPSGLILYCNQRFAEMIGIPLEQVISSDIIGRLAPETWEKISAVATGEEAVVKHESVLLRPNQESIPVHFSASTLPLSDQTVICLVVTDLSLQKSGEQLRLAKEVAERASAAKDSFLAALSHELRTPLTPALMAISALQEDSSICEHARTELAMIQRNIELEIRLIDDLLDLTRIAHGKLEIQEAPVDMHAVLRRAIDICRSSAEAKQVEICVELNAPESRTVGDAVRLQQVVWNIIRNAIKFTPTGGKISVATQGSKPGIFHVSVADTGIGFDPAHAPELFQAFEQVGRDITRHFGGLGLGLSISRSIVLAHGGRIWGESAGTSQGATFHVELPIRQPSAPAPAATGVSTPATAGEGLRILLVEDHEDTRRAFQAILQRRGHLVRVAADGAAALTLAGGEPFDLVISDLGLPDFSGAELMTRLKKEYALPGIAVSGYGMEEDIHRSRKAGFGYHLTKPVDPAKLDRLISEITREIRGL